MQGYFHELKFFLGTVTNQVQSIFADFSNAPDVWMSGRVVYLEEARNADECEPDSMASHDAVTLV
jgi:hypothetical protein